MLLSGRPTAALRAAPLASVSRRLHRDACKRRAVMVHSVANSQTHPGGRTTTIDRMTLKALIEKGSDDDLLRQMVGSVANRIAHGRWRR